jgi:hypothetical protein
VAEHLRAAIKYVFVIFQENESFDHYFGTFPSANGIYSDGQHPRTPKDTPGFTQTYQNIGGKTVTVEPFLIGPDQNANVLDSVDHSHVGMASKMHVSNNTAAMDQFAFAEYTHYGSKIDPAKDAVIKPKAAPFTAPTRTSRRITRAALARESSRVANARTATVIVCVAALPP